MLRIRDAFLIAFCVLAVTPLMLFWAWPHSIAMQAELDEVHERHYLMARNLATTLQRYHRDVLSTFGHVAADITHSDNVGGLKPILANLNIRRLCVVDPWTGATLKSVEGAGGGCPESLPKPLLTTLKSSVKEGGTAMTGVMTVGGSDPTIFVVRHDGDHLVVADMSNAFFTQVAGEITFGKNGRAILVDGSGRSLAHPNADWARTSRDLSNNTVVNRIQQGQFGVARYFSRDLNTEMVVGYDVVPGVGWGVMIAQPLEELQAAARSIREWAILIFGVGVGVAIILAGVFALSIVRPINRTIRMANRMARGDTKARISNTSAMLPWELQRLYESFNTMADSVDKAREREALERANAEAADQDKSEFLRTVNHELRSPLNTIVGYSEIMLGDKADDVPAALRREYLKSINVAGEHLLSLIGDLLDLSRIEAGKYEIVNAPVGTDELVARCESFIRQDAERRGITLTVELPDPAPIVVGDERALFQIMLNLASNAVRYGSDGGHIQFKVAETQNKGIELSIIDDGPGIPFEDLDRVLEPFQRGEASANAEMRGSGLGLSIVSKLVEAHDGRFRLDSAPGMGTAATVVLPPSRVRRQRPKDAKSAAA